MMIGSLDVQIESFAANHAEDIEEATLNALDEAIKRALDNGDRVLALQLRMVRRNPRRRERIIRRVECEAIPLFFKACEQNPSLRSDGEFFKWLVEWFSNGGWEVILKFIMALLPLLTG